MNNIPLDGTLFI